MSYALILKAFDWLEIGLSRLKDFKASDFLSKPFDPFLSHAIGVLCKATVNKAIQRKRRQKLTSIEDKNLAFYQLSIS